MTKRREMEYWNNSCVNNNFHVAHWLLAIHNESG
jgi:hypothetical protein